MKLTCMTLVSPTNPATLRSVEESTVNEAWVMGAGEVIFRVVAVVMSIRPPKESRVTNWKPEIRAVERGLRKPWILKETSVPPGISLDARLVTVRMEFEKEH